MTNEMTNPSNNSSKKNTLLVVDDNDIQLDFLTNILDSEYIIYTARNGIEAIEKARKYHPDLILLDIIMPKMDGYQTVLEMQRCDKICNIPVIFITSLDDDESEIKGLNLKVFDYIGKPYNPDVVKLRIQNNIQRINQLKISEKSSYMDMLTNLPNRRSFEAKIENEWKRAIRENKQISILLMDLDKFKLVNDTYGHQQGDVVLKNVSEIFPRLLKRGSDFVARWGGEEFVALLWDTSLDEAVELAEKIRLSVENAEIPCGDNEIIKITISIGINTQIPEKGILIKNFIKKADVALYIAKQKGRNRLYYDC